jgi:hypothetical protein
VNYLPKEKKDKPKTNARKAASSVPHCVDMLVWIPRDLKAFRD